MTSDNGMAATDDTAVSATLPPQRDLLVRVERGYDAIPRDRARVEQFGPLVLFVPDWPGHAFYARPRPGSRDTPTVIDVQTVRRRQRKLGVPEAFEWVRELAPGLEAAVAATGLSVLHAPLLVLDPARLPDRGEHPAGVRLRVLDPDSPAYGYDTAVRHAVARLGFGAPGTGAGETGPVQRESALREPDEAATAADAQRVRAGLAAHVLAESPVDGALAVGSLQGARPDGDAVAEIVGVATLPAARRRGLAAAVTAALAHRAVELGYRLIFLSAADEAVARVYERVGFQRVGTACVAE